MLVGGKENPKYEIFLVPHRFPLMNMMVKVTTKEYCKADDDDVVDDDDEGEGEDDDVVDDDDLSMKSAHGKSMTLTGQGMTSFSCLNNKSKKQTNNK